MHRIRTWALVVQLGTLLAMARQAESSVEFDWIVRYDGDINSPYHIATRPARLTVTVPPSIDAPHQAVSISLGGTIYLEAKAAGTPPLNYGWRRDGLELPGATAPELVLTNAQLRDAGVYEAVVTNPFGTIARRVGVVSVGTQMEPVWRRRADHDFPFTTALDGGIATDPAGGVYVTGNDGTAKFDVDGHEVWRNNEVGGQAITMQGDSEILVTGPKGTARLDLKGRLIWSDQSITGAAIGADAFGSFFVTQPPPMAPVDTNLVTSKYDGSGKLLWQARYDGGPRSRELSRPLAVDGNDAVVVVGGASWNFVTLKYSPAGDLLWSANFRASRAESATGVAVDGAGNVYVAGVPYGAHFEYRPGHCVVVKYDAHGNQLWVVRALSDLLMWSASLAVGSDENLYGTCEFVGSFKLAPNGAEIWRVAESGRAIALNQRDGVYLMRQDGLILKYMENRVPPKILVPPSSQAVPLGEDLLLTGTVSGSAPLSFQWRHNGALIPGATNASLALTDFSPAAAGDYALQVSNPWGVVISPEASVRLDPRLLRSPSLLPSGDFRVILTGRSAMTYRIETSADLRSWIMVTNVAAPGYAVEIRIPGQTSFTHRFFRASQ